MFRIYPIRLIISILLSGLTAQAGAAPTVLLTLYDRLGSMTVLHQTLILGTTELPLSTQPV
jgi:hypothetical protein